MYITSHIRPQTEIRLRRIQMRKRARHTADLLLQSLLLFEHIQHLIDGGGGGNTIRGGKMRLDGLTQLGDGMSLPIRQHGGNRLIRLCAYLSRQRRDSGRRRGIVNVDTLSRSFSAGDRVDINALKSRSLIPYDTAYIKVLARGMIDKPLYVYANDFSLSAVKMIALTGGRAVKVNTVIK